MFRCGFVDQAASHHYALTGVQGTDREQIILEIPLAITGRFLRSLLGDLCALSVYGQLLSGLRAWTCHLPRTHCGSVARDEGKVRICLEGVT